MFKSFKKRGKAKISIDELDEKVTAARKDVLKNAERIGTLESTVDDMLCRLATARKAQE